MFQWIIHCTIAMGLWMDMINYSPSLDTLPETIQDPQYSDFLKKYKIQVLNPNPIQDSLNCQRSVTVKFPDGWTIHEAGSDGSSIVEFDFLDETRVARLNIRAKLVSYDFWARIHFYSDQEIEEKKKKSEDKKNFEKIYNTYLKNNFAKEWSMMDDTIVYYFKDGTRFANEYFRGYPKDERYYASVVEMSSHKLIGFCNQNDLETKIKFFQNHETRYPQYQIVSHRLDSGMENLHRFEISHMFGYDPNMKDNGYFDDYLFRQKESKYQKKIW